MSLCRSYRLLLLVLISPILISACSPFVTSTPPPSPQPIQVAFTPTLSPLVERLQQCALQQPEIALVTQEMSVTGLDFVGTDLTLWLGEPPQEPSSYAFSLGVDEIVVIAGANVALRELDAQQLQDLYTNANSTYQMWTYGQGHELRALFDQVLFGENSIPYHAKLTPDPAGMIEALTTDPMAVGYIPSSWLEQGIQTISLDGDLQTAFEQPILALTHTEPVGNLHKYLVCLQTSSR